MLIFRLAVRALAWRAGVSVTVFAVALAGVVAAAVGPIYLHAVDETVLTERLAQAPQDQRDIHISRQTREGATDVDWHTQIRTLAGVAADPRWFDPPVFAEQAPMIYKGFVPYATRLVAIDGQCRHLKIVAGRCVSPDSRSDVVLTERTARGLHIAVGDYIRPVPQDGPVPVRLHVVGIGRPIAIHGRFWEPWNYFDARLALSDADMARLDSFFVSHEALASRILDIPETVAANVRLRTPDVHIDDVPALKAHVERLAAQAKSTQDTALSDTVVSPTLLERLNGMNKEMSLARTLIILPTVQLVLLAMFVLYAVVSGTTAALGPEVALAKLRGRRPRSVLLQGVLQPVVLIVLAAPVAAVLAWLLVRVLAPHMVGRAVDVVFPGSAVAVVAAATGGAILAALVAARRIVVSPVGALLRRGSDSSGSSLGLALADAAAVTLAVAGLVELVAGGLLDSGRSDPLSALAPTLIAVAAAIVVLRLLPFAGRLVVRATRDSSRLAFFLAVRQIVRRPAGARVLVPVGVALALAVFAVTNWSVARTNRDARALNEAGAATVLYVHPGPRVTDLRAAVDRADPSRHAMAVAFVQGGRSTPLLAVDTDRFDGVAAWRANYASVPLRTVLSAISPARPPSMTFTGNRLRVDVNLTDVPNGVPIELAVYVTGADHRRRAYDLGRVRPGAGSYRTGLEPCAGSCRITGLTLQPSQDATGGSGGAQSLAATVSAWASGGSRWQPVAGFDQPNRWRSDGTGSVRFGPGGQGRGLGIELAQATGDTPWPQLLSADVPSHLPAVLASGTAEVYPGEAAHDASSFGLDNHSVAIDGVLTAKSIPQLDRYGVLVDLDLAQKAMTTPAGGSTRYQVWVAPGAPAGLRARLAEQGVTVTRVVSAAKYRAALDRSGPAFADALFLVAAGAAVLLAVGAALLGGVTTARRRAYELVAMQAAGIPRRVLRRALATEQTALLGTGLLVGLAAGAGGALLALPSTPFFVDESIGPPIDDGLPLGLIGVVVGIVAAVLAVTCLLIAWSVGRQAVPDRIREAQQ